MIKYFPLIIVAIFLDGFQAGLSIAFLGISSMTSFFAWIPIIGQFLAGTSAGVGTIFGIVVGVCLAVTFGSALIVFLLYNRMFYPQLLFFGGVELIPMINNIPGWTGLVITSIIKKNAEEKRAASASDTTSDTEIQGETENYTEEFNELSPQRVSRVSYLRAANDNGEEIPAREPVRAPFFASKNIDGIRSFQNVPQGNAGNDNFRQEKKVA